VVDVQLHDLVFGVVALDLERENPFVNFACVRLLFGQKQVLGELLSERRTAFDFIGR
jgi:hypothetical protein